MGQKSSTAAHGEGKGSTIVTANAGLMKSVNKNLVLNIIWRRDFTTRAEISRETGLNRATVSTLVDELVRDGLVVEIGPRKSSIGRRPVQLELNAAHRIGIGIDIAVTEVRAAAVDLKGTVLARAVKKNDRKRPSADLVEVAGLLVEELLAQSGIARELVLGVGVGVPGICSRHEGIVNWSNSIGWHDFPLRDLLSRRTGFEVFVENQSYLGAYAEAWLGACRTKENVVYVSAGYGIGAGVLIRRQLYLGSQGFAGRVGHLTIAWDGPKCRCGNRGCWELYASEKATLDRASAAIRERTGKELKRFFRGAAITLQGLASAAESGNEAARAILAETGMYLGVGIAGLITAFNPELVVLGNTVPDCGKWVLDPMLTEIRSRQIAKLFGHIEICVGDLHDDATTLGACYLIFAEKYKLQAIHAADAAEAMLMSSSAPIATS